MPCDDLFQNLGVNGHTWHGGFKRGGADIEQPLGRCADQHDPPCDPVGQGGVKIACLYNLGHGCDAH